MGRRRGWRNEGEGEGEGIDAEGRVDLEGGGEDLGIGEYESW